MKRRHTGCKAPPDDDVGSRHIAINHVLAMLLGWWQDLAASTARYDATGADREAPMRTDAGAMMVSLEAMAEEARVELLLLDQGLFIEEFRAGEAVELANGRTYRHPTHKTLVFRRAQRRVRWDKWANQDLNRKKEDY